MTKELYLESDRLYHDIKHLKDVLNSYEQGNWIKPITKNISGEYVVLSKTTQEKIANAVRHVITDLELEFEELK